MIGLGSAAKSLLTTRGELAWNEVQPSPKVATTSEMIHRWGKSFDCQSGHWTNSWNSLQSPCCVSLSSEGLDLAGSGIDADRLLGDLFEQVAAFLAHQIGQVTVRASRISSIRLI